MDKTGRAPAGTTDPLSPDLRDEGGRPHPGRPHAGRRIRPLVLTLSAWIVYPILYPSLYETAGHSAGVLSVPAVLLVAWFWGLRPGIAAMLLTGFVLNPAFSIRSGAAEPWYLAVASGMPGVLATLLATIAVGRFRDLSMRLHRELDMRLRMEHALREQKEEYRLLVEQAEDIIYRTDAQGRFTYASPATLRILGYRPDEVLGRSFVELVAPEARAATFRFYLRQFARRTPSTYREFPALMPDGRKLWLGQNVRVIFDGDAVAGFQAVARDITRRRHAEAALRMSEHRYRSVVESIKDVVFQTDEAGRWTLLNPAWTELTGVPVHRSLRRPWDDFVHPDDRAYSRARFEALRSGKATSVRYEIRTIRDGGDVCWLEVHARALLDARGRLVGTTGTLSDISDTRRFEAEREARRKAEEMLRLKTTFLDNMSHEIRTPLTGILGFAELLAEEVDEPLREFARRIEKSGRRLLATLNSVLDLAQIEGNSVTLHLEPIDVAAETQELAQILAPIAEEKGLALIVEAPPGGAPGARLDRACLERILTNLVGNAIKFTPAGSVTVAVSTDDDEVRLQVRDTGIGISEAFLPRLFNEFRQESSGQGRSHEGSGLGLVITKRLVEMMHGRITVESRQGAGSTFTVVFPCAPAEACVES